MTREQETELIAEVEQAQDQLRKSMKKSRKLIADYRARLGGGAVEAEPEPLFRFNPPDAS